MDGSSMTSEIRAVLLDSIRDCAKVEAELDELKQQYAVKEAELQQGQDTIKHMRTELESECQRKAELEMQMSELTVVVT